MFRHAAPHKGAAELCGPGITASDLDLYLNRRGLNLVHHPRAAAELS
jgi:hypothetical protein